MKSMNKPELRTYFTKKRAVLSSEHIETMSESICEKILSHESWKKAKTVVLYESIGQEVQTIRLILEAMSDNKKIITTGNKENKYQLVYYPERTPVTRNITPDLIIMPAVACTKDGQRLGRGGGYYDELLKSCPGIFSMALVFDEQITETIPMEAHDQRVNMVVTETNMYRS